MHAAITVLALLHQHHPLVAALCTTGLQVVQLLPPHKDCFFHASARMQQERSYFMQSVIMCLGWFWLQLATQSDTAGVRQAVLAAVSFVDRVELAPSLVQDEAARLVIMSQRLPSMHCFGGCAVWCGWQCNRRVRRACSCAACMADALPAWTRFSFGPTRSP